MKKMAKNSTSLSQQERLSVEIELSWPFLIGSITVVLLAITLNIVEIRLLLKKIRKATDFELVLLNLAVADLLGGIDFAAVTILSAYNFSNREKSIGRGNFGWVFGFILFSIVSSATFVTIIGLERLLAIKVPLRHRMFHLSRRNLFRKIMFTWLFNIIVAVVPLICDYVISNEKIYVGTRTLAYVLAAYLTLDIIVIVVIYIWLGRLVIMRSMKLFEFDKQEYKLNAKSIKIAMKKEKATIAVCAIVLISFLSCNLPMVIHLYQMKVDHISGILIKSNSVCNPLVYFFKGYLERQFGKKSINADSSKEKSEVGSKAKTQSSEDKKETRNDEMKLEKVEHEFLNSDDLQEEINDNQRSIEKMPYSSDSQKRTTKTEQMVKDPIMLTESSRSEAEVSHVNLGFSEDENKF